MTEPQTWTLIGGFFAVYLSTFTLFASLQTRTIKAQVDGILVKIGALESKFDGLDRRIEASSTAWIGGSTAIGRLTGLDKKV